MRSGSTTEPSSERGIDGRSGRVAAGVRPEKITIGAGGGANELPGHGLRDGIHRCRDAGRRAHAPRAPCRCSRRTWTPVGGCLPRARRRAELGPGVDVRRRSGCPDERGGGRMNPRLTRNELLRRGAAGGALLAFPSMLAACGGGNGGGRGDGGELKDVLNFANWPLLHRHRRSPRRSTQFTEETGIKVNYFEEINDNAEYFAKVQGPLSQGRGDRPRHLRVHGQLALPGTPRRSGVGAEARQEPDPEHREPHRRAGEPAVRPGPRVLAAVAVRHDRDRVERGAHRAGRRTIEQLLEDPKLKGKVTMLEELADSVGLVMLGNGDDPSDGHRRDVRTRDRRVQAAVDSGQIRAVHGNDYAAAAGEGDVRGRDRLVRRRRPAPGGQPGSQVGDPAGRAE